MAKSITIREIFLSFVYLVVVFILMLGINFLISWLFEKVLFDILDWFNKKHFLFKFIILIFGGWAIFSLILNFAIIPTSIITKYTIKVFPINLFTLISGFLIATANVIICITQLWQAIPFWNIWFILEFLILSIFIITLSFIVIPNSLSDK